MQTLPNLRFSHAISRFDHNISTDVPEPLPDTYDCEFCELAVNP